MKRIAINEVEPDGLKGMFALENYIGHSGFSVKLRNLIKIRSSQLNGCAYCVDMHTQEALAAGETPRRIFAISAWRESPLFSQEERVLLQLTDEVTFIWKKGLSDDTYHKALSIFGEKSLAQIIMIIVAINSWNRIAISTKMIFEPASQA